MDRYSIVDTYYWWLADHHEGQGSRKRVTKPAASGSLQTPQVQSLGEIGGKHGKAKRQIRAYRLR